ncbi:MAG TPA: hypothetical protein DHV48_04120 [Prolixibacteraceae bacterium]|nr:hypothetical protein [Prolixibacteraceae bacterium]
MNTSKFGFYISMITAIVTMVTFAIAISTPPLSGPFCAGSCFEYPFADIASRFPRDYYWMYPAIVLSFFYLVMMACIYQVTPDHKKVFALVGVLFATMSAMILSVNYFVQVSVIQPSILAGETEGIALITQFNPHGVFIVLEEIGFLMMIISFFALFPIYDKKNSLEKTIRYTAITGFILAVISFALVSVIYGIHREYIFEVIIISITWLELILLGILFSRYFRKIVYQC